MHKRFLCFAASLFGLLLLGLVAFFFWLPQLVEEQVRELLASQNIVAEGVRFEPFERRLRLIGLEKRHDAQRYRIATLEAELPWTLLLRLAPVCALTLPHDGSLPVARKLEGRNASFLLPEGRISVQHLEVDALSLRNAAIFDEPNALPSDFWRQVDFSSLRLRFCSAEFPGRQTCLHVNNVHCIDVQGGAAPRMAQAVLEGIHLRGHLALKASRLELENPHVPDAAAFEAWQRRPGLFARLIGDKPFYARLAVYNLQSGDLEVEQVEQIWNTPQRKLTRFTGCRFSFPLLASLPLPSLTNKPVFSGENLSVLLGENTIQESGQAENPALGKLEYTIRRQHSSEGDFGLDGMFSDLRLHFTDTGLMARLALASGMSERLPPILGMLAGSLLDPSRDGNGDILEALQRFAANPGELDLRSLPGRQFSMQDVNGLVSQRNPAALFRLVAIPGRDDLSTQIRCLAVNPVPGS